MIIYTLPDNRQLQAGSAFTLSVLINGKQDTVSFPGNWLSLASDADLARMNIVKQTVADPTPPAPTEADYSAAIQAVINQTAQAREYDDGVSCASYKNSTVAAWAADATAFIAWRDAVWTYAFAQLAAVQSGSRTPQPSVAQLVSELPSITWPS